MVRKLNEYKNPRDFSDWSNREIVDHIIKNYKRITGTQIKSAFDYDDELMFNQPVVDKTSQKIIDYLEYHGLDYRRIEEILYDLDDEMIRSEYPKYMPNKEEEWWLIMYNEYYLSSNDQNVVFQCFDNIESICQATYNFEEEYSDDWNREDLAGILESI